mmetsp:Transcript_24830/g.68766  ORF Transcript_24830/g.68766 Transcript_24830/m.68766 type:complete len:441 (+) Transcript_24830:51-1373(+)
MRETVLVLCFVLCGMPIEGFLPLSSTRPVRPLGDSMNDSSGGTTATTRATADISNGSQQIAKQVASQALSEGEEIYTCLKIVGQALFRSKVEATDIVECCDTLDELGPSTNDSSSKQPLITQRLQFRRRALEFQRYTLLAKLLQQDYDAYVATSSFLSPSRIPRMDLPNVQDVPLISEPSTKSTESETSNTQTTLLDDQGRPLVADCSLEDLKYKNNPLDSLLLSLFRKLVTKHTGGVTSDQPGLTGLLEQGRTYMLQEGQTPEAQHKMVYNTLGSLMTPALPPFYRIFMSGIVPKVNSQWDGKQLGPWFYAPFLTSVVTPLFFAFLVGPSRPNFRQDGQLGGLVVEKCQFLQESGCKGLCLHQCKLPAQQFFAEELGLPLTVKPNFVTQECQWSFGEEPLPPAQDESFPDGCLSGCPSRKALAESVGKAEAREVDLCNY